MLGWRSRDSLEAGGGGKESRGGGEVGARSKEQRGQSTRRHSRYDGWSCRGGEEEDAGLSHEDGSVRSRRPIRHFCWASSPFSSESNRPDQYLPGWNLLLLHWLVI